MRGRRRVVLAGFVIALAFMVAPVATASGATISATCAWAGHSQPRYIKVMPIVDGWGHPYRYECGTPGTDACQEYIVGSGGKDGIFEHESLRDYPKPGGATQAFDCDLIYANGSFIEYPESMARGD